MLKIGFIGLGQMGLPMALNLIRGGHTLSVYDLQADAVRTLVAEGARGADSPLAAADGMDVLITMLPNGDTVRNTLFGPSGALGGPHKPRWVIDMSTIHPLQTDSLARDVQQLGLTFVDAPVGRTSDHAISGQLLILAGGTEEQISPLKPLFDCMGSETIVTGATGNGIRVKIINNYMSITLNVLSGETYALCEAIGLSWDTAMKVMSGTPAGKGHFTTTWSNKFLRGDFSPSFMIDHAHKDLGIALDLANQVSVPVPMGAASREVYNTARAAGRGHQDWTAVVEQTRVQAALPRPARKS